MRLTRRGALRGGAAAGAALALGPPPLGRAVEALARRARLGRGPYGALRPPDENGIRLPAGFRSRLIAQAPTPVAGTLYPWHNFPDAMGTFALADGGFVLVSNSEVPVDFGGASAIRFDRGGAIVDAYRILSGTSTNCAGGVTPWGTWLSCEEDESGVVWECDPGGGSAGVPRPAMGVFKHEAACVDPRGRRVYLTEDQGEAGFYRFTPASYPDLSAGRLELAEVLPNGRVRWRRVPDPSASRGRTLAQVPKATRFRRGEGIWFDRGTVYMATTADDRVWAYDTRTREIEIVYDGVALGAAAPLHGVDNLTVSARSGDLFVCEDGDDLDVCVISPEGEVARFASVTGPEHSESELTGPVFDPSGTRFSFSSQRAFGLGAVFEVSGPFRSRRPNVERERLRVSVLGKPTATQLQRIGLAIRVQRGSGQGRREPLRAEVRAVSGGRRRIVLAALERELAPGVGRARLRIPPVGGTGRLPAGSIAVLAVSLGRGAGRRAVSVPVRLD